MAIMLWPLLLWLLWHGSVSSYYLYRSQFPHHAWRVYKKSRRRESHYVPFSQFDFHSLRFIRLIHNPLQSNSHVTSFNEEEKNTSLIFIFLSLFLTLHKVANFVLILLFGGSSVSGLGAGPCICSTAYIIYLFCIYIYIGRVAENNI